MQKKTGTILLIGSDITLGYLLGRYAERSGYQLVIHPKLQTTADVEVVNPVAIFFLSTELLSAAQGLLEEIANQDRGIVVCVSTADLAEATRDLGADYSLPHPITYDNFYQALVAIGAASPD